MKIGTTIVGLFFGFPVKKKQLTKSEYFITTTLEEN
jgi:hypothetical protein